jgi:hypothetical protein
MKKSTKILLAIATVFPFLYMIFFFVAVFSMILFPPDDPSEGGIFPVLMMVLFPLHFFNILLIWGLTAYYIVNVFRNDRVDKDKKVLWAVIIFLGNMVAMPIYWYQYIWNEETELPKDSDEQKMLKSVEAYSWANDETSKEREKEYIPPTQL